MNNHHTQIIMREYSLRANEVQDNEKGSPTKAYVQRHGYIDAQKIHCPAQIEPSRPAHSSATFV